MIKFIRRLFILIFFLGAVVAALAGYFGYEFFSYRNSQAKTIYINKGDSVRSIAQKLTDEGVILNALVMEAYLRISGKAALLKAGEYEFELNADAWTVMEKIISGKTKTYQFTIPEGQNIKGVCRILADKKITSMEHCLKLAHDTRFLKDTAGAESLEGYLFPETYTYDSQTTPEDVFAAMLNMFYQKIGASRIDKARRRGLSLHEVVILASVVEKETGAAEERPLIAGVFSNRLKIDMPLQSDPTTIYGVPDFDGNLTRKHLETDTPYNTYTRKGLPKGPICNPGLAAIDAVLEPATTKALYFVAKGDGTHYFSESLDEHNRAVQQYQIQRRSQSTP